MKDFPYDMFPIRLEHKDGKDKKTCWFQCQSHFEKYVNRYKLKPKDCKVKVRDDLQFKFPKKKKTKQKKLFSTLDDFFTS